MNWIRRTLRPEQLRELSLILLLIVLVLFFSTQISGYLSARTVNRISSGVALIAVVAIGQALVVLTRNIDLSVGSIVGFTAYFVGIQLISYQNMPPLLAVALAIGTGAGLGLINGLVVAYGRVPSIIATLGTLAFYRTFLVNYSESRTVTTNDLPPWIINLAQVDLLNLGGIQVRPNIVIALAVMIVFQLVLLYLPFGRRLYAIGSNPDAAQFAGLPMRRTVLLAFVLCGALSGLGGFMFLSRFGNVTVVAAQGMELQSVAAVVVGGVNTFGGSGTALGALLGATVIETLGQSLVRWLGISEFWRDAILGLLILLAVASDAVILNQVRRVWSSRRRASTHETTPAKEGARP